MNKKIIGLSLLTLLASSPVQADEGMWLPSNIGERIKDMRSKGFRLKADDIYSDTKPSLKDAVMQFGGGCTGEFVSDQGLLLTNHHCGYGSIQKLSSVEHDYLTDGYWAGSQAEELHVPGLTISLLVRIENVTQRLANGEQKEAIVEAATKEGVGYRARIESMYYGNEHYLFVYQTFRDVRLVGTPPSSIGKFGGDTDNWIWPRHTGDFSIFRVYADRNNQPADYAKDNVPYRPKRHFEISTEGIDEGDFTMIYGFPGNTQEYVISDAVRYVAEQSNPMKIALRTERLNIIAREQAKDPAVRIAYAAKHAGIANAWKKWQGESLGLQRLNTVTQKQDYERQFAAWAASQPAYASLLDSMRHAYATTIPHYYARELFNETVVGIEAYDYVRNLLKAYSQTDVQKRNEALQKTSQSFLANYRKNIDRELAHFLFGEYLRQMPSERIPAYITHEVERHGGAKAYIDHLYDHTRLLQASLPDSSTAAEDVFAKFARAFEATEQHNRQYAYRNISNVPAIEQWYRPYMQALQAWDKQRAFYPDANFTLRVAYGAIKGYENADGEYHTHLTTLDGIVAKDNPEIYDYNIPQTLRDIHRRADYGRWAIEHNGRNTIPVCFLASNHTTGGNSGSPVLNSKGQLIGINFDRTWRSTMSDMAFDPNICRNIAVDIRYVLFVIDRIGGAHHLIEEMGIK